MMGFQYIYMLKSQAIANIKYDDFLFDQYTHLHSVSNISLPIFDVQFSNIIVVYIYFFLLFEFPISYFG